MKKEILEELKNTKYQLNQYRLLTNKLINRNVSQYNIDKFIEEEYIQDIYKNIQDYEYDLYNWLSSDLLDDVSNELIRLETQLKKQKEINQKAIEYINKFKDSPEYIDAFDITYWQDEVLAILEDKEV